MDENFDEAAGTASLHDQLTVEALLTSLRSTVCPACGGRKKTMQTLCAREYLSLPREMKLALYRKIGKGYKEAVHEAFIYLDVVRFTWSRQMPPPKLAAQNSSPASE